MNFVALTTDGTLFLNFLESNIDIR